MSASDQQRIAALEEQLQLVSAALQSIDSRLEQIEQYLVMRDEFGNAQVTRIESIKEE